MLNFRKLVVLLLTLTLVSLISLSIISFLQYREISGKSENFPSGSGVSRGAPTTITSDVQSQNAYSQRGGAPAQASDPSENAGGTGSGLPPPGGGSGGGGTGGGGLIVVSSNPLGADVFVNNVYSGYTTTQVPVSPGTYRLLLTKSGYADYFTEVYVNGVVVFTFDLQPAQSCVEGQPCCPGDKCANSTLACNNATNVCMKCGAFDKICCGGRKCTNSNQDCTGTAYGGKGVCDVCDRVTWTCGSCGNYGQKCCPPGSRCDPGYSCKPDSQLGYKCV